MCRCTFFFCQIWDVLIVTSPTFLHSKYLHDISSEHGKYKMVQWLPPQISVSKLTLFVLAVYLLAIAICLWNSVCCRPCFSLPHGGTFSCTTVSLHCLPCILCLYLHCPSHPSVYHAKCISKLSWIVVHGQGRRTSCVLGKPYKFIKYTPNIFEPQIYLLN